jgi:outer membrane cobalamin receptor
VEGTSTDRLFPTGQRVGGGSQVQQGTFAQLDAGRGPVKLFLGGRHHFTGQDSRFFSPSAGATAGKGIFRARASVYRSFRAPTLNELYREFRAGNAETRANANLRPETLTGVEAGFDVVAENTRMSLSLFRNSLDELITNVTLSTSATAIVRQRQNAGSALARGVDWSARTSWRNWRGEIGYLFADTRFSTGERVPQVPRHSGNAQITYARPDTLISAGLRTFSLQFEDDRNQFILPGYATLQLAARQRLTGSLFATFELDNATDRVFLTGFSPVPLVGTPRLWRAGLRWSRQ